MFTTHDASLLTGGLFRRDQVWFTEKNQAGATDLYSLQDFKDVREDESFDKGYLRGRYRAIPFVRSFDFPPVPGAHAEAAVQRVEPSPRASLGRPGADRKSQKTVLIALEDEKSARLYFQV